MSKEFITFSNQKIIHINKKNYTDNYLTIGITEWVDASKNLSPNTFKLYLYISSNADGFNLALSRQAVMNLLGISKDSYIRGVKELEDKHYIVQKQGNIYDFYTTPMYAEVHTTGKKNDTMYADTHTVCMQESIHDVCTDAYSMYAKVHTEINNIKNINKKNNTVADAPTLASLESAYAVDSKWIPKDEKSKDIFGSDIHSDKRVMEILKEEFGKEYYGIPKTIEDICKETWVTYCHVNTDKIAEYCNEVLMK